MRNTLGYRHLVTLTLFLLVLCGCGRGSSTANQKNPIVDATIDDVNNAYRTPLTPLDPLGSDSEPTDTGITPSDVSMLGYVLNRNVQELQDTGNPNDKKFAIMLAKLASDMQAKQKKDDFLTLLIVSLLVDRCQERANKERKLLEQKIAKVDSPKNKKKHQEALSRVPPASVCIKQSMGAILPFLMKMKRDTQDPMVMRLLVQNLLRKHPPGPLPPPPGP